MGLPLPPVFLALLAVFTRHTLGAYLSDYEGCGRRFETNFKIENECYRNCEWMPNPYYRNIYNVTVEETGQCLSKDVSYYMMTRMIPKNLDCMSECNLPDNRKDRFGYNSINCGWIDNVDDPVANTPETVEEKYNECYLNKKKKFATGEKSNLIGKDDTFFHYARSHRDLIFDICYVALLFK